MTRTTRQGACSRASDGARMELLPPVSSRSLRDLSTISYITCRAMSCAFSKASTVPLCSFVLCQTQDILSVAKVGSPHTTHDRPRRLCICKRQSILPEQPTLHGRSLTLLWSDHS